MEEKEEEIQVEFRPKSRWQQRDCINSKCSKTSTLEAVCRVFIRETMVITAVRCCDNERCKERASTSARGWITAAQRHTTKQV